MSENTTTEQVFGPSGNGTGGSIPHPVLDGLKILASEFHIEKVELQTRYVEFLNQRPIQNTTEPFTTAYRALRANYLHQYASVNGYKLSILPISIQRGRKTQKNTWMYSVIGLVRSDDSAHELVGPATALITGFPSEEACGRAVQRLRTGQVYRVNGSPESTSPTGKLGPGSVATLFINSDAPWEAYAPDPADVFWSTATDTILAHFPVQPVPTVLKTGLPNQLYHVEGEIVGAHSSVNEKTKETQGNITLGDDSLTAEQARNSRGGLFAFLPREYVSVAGLPVGSRVSVLIDGYVPKPKPGQAPRPEVAGSTPQLTWTARVVKVLVDMGGGLTVPNPEKVVISTGPTPPTADTWG